MRLPHLAWRRLKLTRRPKRPQCTCESGSTRARRRSFPTRSNAVASRPSRPGNRDVMRRFAPYSRGPLCFKAHGPAPPLGVDRRREDQPLVIDERPPQVDVYRRKRDPDRTPEPFGGGRPGAGGLFVVQQHAARRLHYDLRLEMDGVLKSWAVPKGPRSTPEVKRLAVHVEDHPLDYADFEGVIPKDNYGAGAVIVWDHGRYRSPKPEDPRAQLERGLLEVEFRGHKLRGRWTLARMGGSKAQGLASRPEGRRAGPRSTRSPSAIPGRSAPGSPSRRCATGRRAEDPSRAGLAASARRPRTFPAREQGLMLATLADAAARGRGLAVRDQVRRRARARRAAGRRGDPARPERPDRDRHAIRRSSRRSARSRSIASWWTARSSRSDARGRPELPAAPGAHGPHPPRRRGRRAGARCPSRPCSSTASLSRATISGACRSRRGRRASSACSRRSASRASATTWTGMGAAFLEAAAEPGSRASSPSAGRAPTSRGARTRWLKIKCHRRQEFVIGGYTEPQGSRARFGALHLGLYDGAQARLRVQGRHRLRRRRARATLADARAASADRSPFDAGTPAGRGHHWVEPRLVAEVRFTEWTRDGGIRHPIVPGLRDDVRPEDCRRESPAGDWRRTVGAAVAASPRRRGRRRGRRPPPKPARDAVAAPASRVRLTNLDKVFWPAEGYTKGDLVRYYDAIAPVMLPYLRDRPDRPHALSGRHRRQVLLPEGRAGVRARLGADGDASTRGTPTATSTTSSSTTRRRSGTWPTWARFRSTLERAGPVARAPRLARPRSRPEGRAVHRRGAGRADRSPGPRRPRAAEPREDVRRRPASTSWSRSAPGTPTSRRGPSRACSRVAGRGGRAGDRHGGAPARRARRQGLRRLRPERPRPHDRRALLGPAAAGRARSRARSSGGR